jgi:hypothetical protein
MIFASVALGVLMASTGPRPDPMAQKQSPAAKAAANAIEKRAASEIAALDPKNPWAGAYYAGDGTGANLSLTLAPHAGFAFEWNGCLGLYDRNYGAVASDAGELHLHPRLPNATEGIHVEQDLIPIAWGDRRYLIGAGKTKDFCNTVNSGAEPRTSAHGLYLLRRGDETKPATGRPQGPDGVLPCLLETPIQTRIVALGPSSTKDDDKYESRTSRVTLGAGSAEGVWDGMTFVFETGRYDSVRVVKVGEHTSEAEIADWGAKGTTKPPTIDALLTTRR